MAGSLSPTLAQKLEDAAPGGVRFDVDLSTETRWKIGGRALAVVEPGSAAETAAVMRAMRDEPLPFVVVGETSNILFDSDGFDGVLMRIGQRMSHFRIEGTRVVAEAGVSVPTLARAVAEAGLTGMEHAAGIPGTLGGLVLMNGGSQRKGIGSVVQRVVCADENGELVTFTHDELGFAYRTSSLQGRRVAVVEVELELAVAEAAAVVAEVEAILAERSQKFPLDLPNCGSTFLSDPAMYSIVGPPGKVIEQAGLKGLTRGDAQISELHANFIVNNGAATDEDVLYLIAVIRSTVTDRTGFTMDTEVRHLSADGVLRPAHAAAEERWPDVTPVGGK